MASCGSPSQRFLRGTRKRSLMSKHTSKATTRVLWVAFLLLLLAAGVWAQAIFATLTGIVSDSSGAVVANAKVTLKNSLSGDSRESTTDGQGYYTFASVPVGTYNVTIE